MAFLSIERVSKYFPVLEGASPRTGRQALFCVFKDVDLRIEKGEFSLSLVTPAVARAPCSILSLVSSKLPPEVLFLTVKK